MENKTFAKLDTRTARRLSAIARDAARDAARTPEWLLRRLNIRPERKTVAIACLSMAALVSGVGA
jgi:hypothetical protein